MGRITRCLYKRWYRHWYGAWRGRNIMCTYALCCKAIKFDSAIRLDFEFGGQGHNLTFCNFKCLRKWLEDSYWK